MNALIVRADADESMGRAVEILLGGGLVAFPTDTVYGLGAMAFNAAAVARLYEAKKRPVDKAVAVLLSSLAELDRVAGDVGWTARRLAEHFWPGPLTIVVPKHANLPGVVADSTVGVRIPDHFLALELLGATGPLAVSSANLSGGPNPVTAADVVKQLGRTIELVLDGGNPTGGRPSTVVDCSREPMNVLREGDITYRDLMEVLR